MKKALSIMAASAACLGSTTEVSAGPILIANAGFESSILGDDGFTGNVIPGWTGTDSGAANNFGVYNPPAITFPAQAPEGLNVAYIERGAIFQTLTDVLSPGDYVLTVQVGDSLFDPVSPFTVQLRAGGSVLSQASLPGPANGTFTLVTVNYTAGAGDAQLGEFLEIRLIDNLIDKSTEPYFDDVRLEFVASAVPDQSATLLLLSTGLLGLAGVRSRAARSGT